MGEALGLHRALDTGGALLGPLLAVFLFSVAPGSYQTVFVASFLIALVGLALLWLFVENRVPLAAHARGCGIRSQRCGRTGRSGASCSPPRLLSVPAVSDSFLFLTARNRVGIEQRWFPLLFVAESVVYLVLALPLGRLADRIGAGRVLLGGQIALGASFALLVAGPSKTVLLVALPACLGVFFAATDGVLAALASEAVPGLARTTGLAVVGVVLAAGQAALAATGYGTVWQRDGPHAAVTAALVALVVAGAAAAVVLRPWLAGRGPTAAAAVRPTDGAGVAPASETPVVSAARRWADVSSRHAHRRSMRGRHPRDHAAHARPSRRRVEGLAPPISPRFPPARPTPPAEDRLSR